MPPKSKSDPDPLDLRRALSEKLEEHKKLLTAAGAIVVLLVVGLVLFLTLSKRAVEENWHELLGIHRQSPIAAATLLEDLVEQGGSDIAPHALYNLAVVLRRDKDHERALELLDRLKAEYADDAIYTLPSPDSRYSVIELLRRRILAEMEWNKQNTYTGPEPAKDRVALIETTKGDFWIAFYADQAPKHVESFVRLAKAGKLNGTKVYAAHQTRIEWGGEATRDDDPMNDEPEDEDGLLESEPGRYRIRHDRGAISTVALEGGESPTRFAVVVGASDLGLEKKQTVFGTVLTDRGTAMVALDEIRNSPTYGAAKKPELTGDERALKIPNHPVDDIVVERVSVWSGKEIEDGHAWDTAEVTPPEKPSPPPPVEKPKDEDGDEEPDKSEETPKEPAEEPDQPKEPVEDEGE